MNNATRFSLIAALVSSSFVVVQASASAVSAPGKIITFSAKDVMQTSETGQMLQTKLQDEQDKLAAPLRKEAEMIQKKEQKLIEKSKADNTDANDLEFEKRELTLQVQKLQSDSRKLEEQFGGVYQKAMLEFEKKLKQTVEDLGLKNGWDVVFVEEQVFWSNPKLSKTSEIKSELDKRVKKANQEKQAKLEIASSSSASSSSVKK